MVCGRVLFVPEALLCPSLRLLAPRTGEAVRHVPPVRHVPLATFAAYIGAFNAIKCLSGVFLLRLVIPGCKDAARGIPDYNDAALAYSGLQGRCAWLFRNARTDLCVGNPRLIVYMQPSLPPLWLEYRFSHVAVPRPPRPGVPPLKQPSCLSDLSQYAALMLSPP